MFKRNYTNYHACKCCPTYITQKSKCSLLYLLQVGEDAVWSDLTTFQALFLLKEIYEGDDQGTEIL